MSTKATEAARRYYDTRDVNGFYTTVWGGDDIHIGIYNHRRETVVAADHLGPGTTVLDLGSGYGGPARYLAARFGCRVVALNISGVQNRRHREINVARGLDGLIDVVTGSLENVLLSAGHCDVVWSQEAFSHSDDQAMVLGEALRVLKPDARLVFTDLMAADNLPADVLRPVVARTGVEALPTPGCYRKQLAELGFAHIEFADHSHHLLTHYLRITEETRLRVTELANVVSDAYVESLLENLPPMGERVPPRPPTLGNLPRAPRPNRIQ